MFSFFRRKRKFFTEPDQARIVEAIRHAEKRTSGEIRVFVESKCRYMDAIDRAAEIFFGLKMEKTDDRNAVLLYVAMKDHQLAVFADKGIYERMGQTYWHDEIRMMTGNFNKQNYADGIRQCVTDIGEALHHHFPFDNDTDKNELPDDIVFGH